MTLQSILTVVLLGTGLFFLVVATIGFVRLPDVFSRLHVMGIIDTLGVPLVLLAGTVHLWPGLPAVKLVLGLLFIAITSPLVGHLLARAALVAGHQPGMIEDSTELQTRYGSRYAALPGREEAGK